MANDSRELHWYLFGHQVGFRFTYRCKNNEIERKALDRAICFFDYKTLSFIFHFRHVVGAFDDRRDLMYRVVFVFSFDHKIDLNFRFDFFVTLWKALVEISLVPLLGLSEWCFCVFNGFSQPPLPHLLKPERAGEAKLPCFRKYRTGNPRGNGYKRFDRGWSLWLRVLCVFECSGLQISIKRLLFDIRSECAENCAIESLGLESFL